VNLWQVNLRELSEEPNTTNTTNTTNTIIGSAGGTLQQINQNHCSHDFVRDLVVGGREKGEGGEGREKREKGEK
jgi:hypothetical protein